MEASIAPAPLRASAGAREHGDRLGIDHPAGAWPTTPRLKAYEAAGFRYLQMRVPPAQVLCDAALTATHAGCLSAALRLTGLELILHAPDDLRVGSPLSDAVMAGTLRYAQLAGAGIVVYHGARVPVSARDADALLASEERSLRRLLRRAAAAEVQIAIENLAPVYPGADLVCFDPAAVAGLVRRLDSAYAGVCLDLGHAHIVAGLRGLSLSELIAPALDDVILFHVHDNFGARVDAPRAGGIEPVRLDLHLAPGAGSLPWAEIAPVLSRHAALLQLEVQRQRPEPATLAVVMRELLARAPDVHPARRA